MKSDVTTWFVGGARDFELVELAGGAVGSSSQGEHFDARHLIGGESSGLIRADNRGATKGLDRGQRAHDGVFLGHAVGAQGKAGGNDGRKTFGDSSDGEGDGDLKGTAQG